MNKNIFWFVAVLTMLTGHAFNGVRSDLAPNEQGFKKEILRLDQELLAKKQKNKNHLLQLKASHYRNLFYGAIGGLVVGCSSGLLIDKFLGLKNPGYTTIPLTVICPFLGFCAVQIYYIGLSRLIKKQIVLDELDYALHCVAIVNKEIQKTFEFTKDK